MSWRVGNVSGTVTQATGPKWRVANVSGSLSGSWRVAKVSGTISTVPPATWRVEKVSGNVYTGWRVCNVSGTVTAATAPVITGPANANVDPVLPYVVVGTVTNAVAPDSWSFTSPGITFAVSGNKGTFNPPGSLNGSNVVVTISATRNGNVSNVVTVTYAVRKGTVFRVAGGAYIPTSPFTTVP